MTWRRAAYRSALGRSAAGLQCLTLVIGARGDTLDSTSEVKRGLKLDGTGCVASLLGAVTSQLRIELANQASPLRALRVRMVCRPSAVEVAVLDEGQNRELVRQRVDLIETRQHLRPRIVALTIAELIRELEGPDRERPPAGRKASSPARATTEAAKSAESASPAIRLLAFAQTSSFRFDTPLAWGGGLRLDYGVSRFVFGMDSTVARGNESRSLGSVTTTMLGLSPYAAWAPERGAWFGRLGLGHTLGIARISGEARAAGATGEVITGVWATPYALAALGTELRPLVVELRGQLGWVTLPVEGLVAEGRTVRISGAWSCLQFGAGVAF